MPNQFKKIICPYCFYEFREPNDVLFRASYSIEGDQDFSPREDEALNMYNNEFGKYPAGKLNVVIEPFDKDLVKERKKNPGSEIITRIVDKNGCESTERLCRKCHNTLPVGIGFHETTVISMAGILQSGKSVYMMALTKELMEGVSGVSFIPQEIETHRRFKEYYNNGMLPYPTPINQKQSAYIYKFSAGNTVSDTILSFFDVPGEFFTADLRANVRADYIKHSDAILLVIDPFRISKLRKKIKEIRRVEKEENFLLEEQVLAILKLIESFIGGTNKYENNKITIPIAIILAKSDLLENTDIVPDDSTIFQDFECENKLDLKQCRLVHDEVIKILKKYQSNIVDSIDRSFKNYHFFAVSSLGKDFSNDNFLSEEASSRRIAEPFLWLMYKLGYIEAIEEEPVSETETEPVPAVEEKKEDKAEEKAESSEEDEHFISVLERARLHSQKHV